ncbi:MAG: hypothetical protein HGA76_11550, partial [Candidatus Firestonebacteria bacterium]|nr:hypothetical protein [Candidatus Firestonebacteria bacterium]
MITLSAFFWQLLLTGLAAGAAIYLPGRLGLRLLKVSLTPLEKFAATWVGGAGLLVLVYWCLSLLHAQGLLWFYVLGAAGTEAWWLISQLRRERLLVAVENEVPVEERLRAFWPLWILLGLGIVAQGRFCLGTGWLTARGVDLLAWHGCDATWHVFNLFQLSRTYPIELGGFSGHILTNYHIFSPLLWGAVLRLAPVVDAWNLYLHIAPIFYSGLLVLTTFVAARTWFGKNATAYLAAGLVMFSANFGYFMPLLFGPEHYFLWDSIFWVSSPIEHIFNPGVVSSHLFLLMGLWALIRWLRERHWGFLILVALFWGMLPGFKIFPAALVLIALFMVAAIRWLRDREYALLWAWLAMLPVFALSYLPMNSQAKSLVHFLPGFNLGSMLVAPDRMALMTSTQLKILFAQRPGLVALMMLGLLLVFVIGNLGVRIMALPMLYKSLRFFHKTEPVMLFTALMSVGGFLVPILFVQTGLQWNTVQFVYPVLILASLPAAEQFWLWVAHFPRPQRLLWLGLVLALGLPGWVQQLWVVDWNSGITPPLFEALHWLKNTGTLKEVVLRPLPDSFRTDEGYQQLMRRQIRGDMTSLKVWNQEAQAFSAGNTAAVSALMPVAIPAAKPDVAAANTSTAESSKTDWLWMRQDVMAVACMTFKNSYLEGMGTAQ